MDEQTKKIYSEIIEFSAWDFCEDSLLPGPVLLQAVNMQIKTFSHYYWNMFNRIWDKNCLLYTSPEKEIKVSLPETQAQRVLADFVCEVLQCEEVSIDEKLFDMGANSLHILLLQGKVEKTFHIKMNVVNFFEYTTIRELAEFITGNQEDLSLIHI